MIRNSPVSRTLALLAVCAACAEGCGGSEDAGSSMCGPGTVEQAGVCVAAEGGSTGGGGSGGKASGGTSAGGSNSGGKAGAGGGGAAGAGGSGSGGQSGAGGSGGGGGGKQANGATCDGAGDCTSGYCKDGVCCESGCTGTCQSCGVTGSQGSCATVVGADDSDTCTGTFTCNGAGACKSKNGQTCSASADCSSANCKDGYCCDGTCTAACSSCNQTGKEGACSPVKGADDADTCATANTCDGNGACKKKNGQSCSSGGECVSTICADGVCCNSTCTGTCMACNAAGKAGTCSSISGQDVGTCSGTNTCAAGACKKVEGQPCSASIECVNNMCVPYYTDNDGDYYGTGSAGSYCYNGENFAGKGIHPGDCCDSDSKARPAVAPSNPCENAPTACGNWDYNCDGQQTPWAGYNCQLPANKVCGGTQAGWQGSVPACGGFATYCSGNNCTVCSSIQVRCW